MNETDTMDYLTTIIPEMMKYIDGESEEISLSIVSSLLANVIYTHNISESDVISIIEGLYDGFDDDINTNEI